MHDFRAGSVQREMRAAILFVPWLTMAPVACTPRVPLEVSSPSEPVSVYRVVCLAKAISKDQVCAVVINETESAPPDPKDAFASRTHSGSTSSSFLWFSQPRSAPPRVFTLMGNGASRIVTSRSKVLLYVQSSAFGGTVTAPSAQGTVAYVVDASGTRAIAGGYAEVRYVEASMYRDPVAHGDRLPAGDRDWLRAKPNARRLARAHFPDVEGGYVEARFEARDTGTPCVSFGYFVNDELRGAFSCSQVPRGILIIEGTATWVFDLAP